MPCWSTRPAGRSWTPARSWPSCSRAGCGPRSTSPTPSLPDGHPLWSAPGLLLTPHVAGATPQASERRAAIITDQLTRYAAGWELRNVVGEQGY